MRSYYTYLSSWTEKVLTPSFNPEDIGQLVAGTLDQDDYIKNNQIRDFNGLVPVEKQDIFNFANWKIWVNPGKEEVFHYLVLKDTTTIDKEQWQYFWSLFNIFQSVHFIEEKMEISSDVKTLSEDQLIEQLLPVYDESLHEIIREAVNKKVITNTNSTFLDSLLNDKGEVIADADLVLDKIKVAVNPLSEESTRVFLDNGYTIMAPEELMKNL